MNKTTIFGRLGRQPDMTYSPSGVAVTKTSVAVSRKVGSGDSRKEETTWFNVTAFDKTAEVMDKYLSKGDQVIIEGRVSAHAYMGKDGKPAASLELTVDNLHFVGGGKKADPTAGGSAGESDEPADFPF